MGVKHFIRRAAHSTCENAAEGFGRYSQRDFSRFLTVAKSSLAYHRLIVVADPNAVIWLVDDAWHPVQKAMVQELGPQCGFCTSGQVVSAVALLKHNPKPTVEEAPLAMSGNLCRCGAYDHYLKAVMRAAREA